MNKSQELLKLSNKEIRQGRAKMTLDEMKFQQEEVIRTLESKKRAINIKLLELSDISRDSQFSLNFVKKDFSAKKWAEDTQQMKVDLLNIEVELAAATETYKEWFGEETKK